MFLCYYMLLGILGLWLVWDFSFVDGCIKHQTLPFACQFFKNSFVKESFFHSQIEFLDVHDDYYMAIVCIHYIFFPSFQFNT